MPRPLRLQFAGAMYHLTQRGNGAQEVFLSRQDRQRFLDQLDYCMERHRVILYAYCLMPNHFHLFVRTPMGNVDRFMQGLNTAYAMYFRYKHTRPGHCWQGRYGAKLVQGEKYILGLSRYIHLNPVKGDGWRDKPCSQMLRYLRAYEWSSYRGSVGLCSPEERIDYSWLKDVGMSTRLAYRKYVEQMLATKDDEYLAAAEASSYAIGDEEYIEAVSKEIAERKRMLSGSSDIAWPKECVASVEDVEAFVLREFGIDHSDLLKHGCHAGVAKAVVVELCCRTTGSTQRAIAEYFGYGSEAGVCKQRQRLAAKLTQDKKLGEQIKRLESRIYKNCPDV